MPFLATSVKLDPVVDAPDLALIEAFAAVRAEMKAPEQFPSDAVAEAERTSADPPMPERDETAVPFWTVDPLGSMDLDQAMHLERSGQGYRVRYAIADVPAFITPGGALDQEVHRRGQTIYCPDTRVPLHPPVLSEGAASLLPDVERPALVWDIELGADGERSSATLYRARVRSRARYTYEQVQRLVDSEEADEPLLLLRAIGQLRVQRESARGGASLPMPEQQVHRGQDGFALRLRPLLAAEDWNAQISLLTGMAAAQLMIDGGVGILRTMPAPDPGAIVRFRREARALGQDWPEAMPYGDFLRTLDWADPKDLAIINTATALFRGAGYTPFDGQLPPEPERAQAAIAAPYAHVTAPLRRLVDRYGLAVCLAVAQGEAVPPWARAALPDLPATMAESDRLAKTVDKACIDVVEAAVLADRVGQTFAAVVVDELSGGELRVQLQDPPVSAAAEGEAELGSEVRVRLVEADLAQRRVRFRIDGAGSLDGG